MRHSGCVKRLAAGAAGLVVLGLAGLAGADAPPAGDDAARPPIPVVVTLDEPGFVTLVIEDAAGTRVRNLVSETPLPAGVSTLAWDGLDDCGRDTLAAAHAIYHVPGAFVAPGRYRVRGLVRPRIDLRYAFTVYHEGRPPWRSSDKASQWLANHTPPQAVLFVPELRAPARAGKPAPGGQIVVGSKVSEGGSGVAWLDLDGRKLHGQVWIGGVWTGASHLARDDGAEAAPGVYAYTACAWPGDKFNGNRPELRLFELLQTAAADKPRDTRFGYGEDRAVLAPMYALPAVSNDEQKAACAVTGLAAHDALVVVAFAGHDQVLFVDARERRALGTVTLANPRGLAFDAAGRLYAVTAGRVVRFDGLAREARLPPPTVLVSRGLDDPNQLALDAAGNLYVSDLGDSHQVKVFAPDGAFVRAVGRPGRPGVGRYDPDHMNNPAGLAIDGRGRLWVAENEFAPKRLSVWDADGRLVRAFYGPPRYGGGGRLDGGDATRFFYADAGGLEFALDWTTGTSVPAAVYYRPAFDTLKLKRRGPIAPEQPFHVGGRVYLTDAYNENPTGGSRTVSLWILEDGVARPVAAIGQPSAFQPEQLPPGLAASRRDDVQVAWSDRNGDGTPQPGEFGVATNAIGTVSILPDLSAVTSAGLLYRPTGFTPGGAPLYDVAHPAALATGTQRPVSTGCGQAMLGDDGWLILTTAPKPFAPQGIGGVRDGVARWSYPNLWPGLHAGHNAPLPDFPGELIATTRLLGPTVKPRGSGVELWAINGDKGCIYLFTTDGLFVATLFRDARTAAWDLPVAERGMLLNDVSTGTESFWPSLAQTPDGAIFLVVNWPSIVRVEGLEGIRRLPDRTLEVDADQLREAQAAFVRREAERQAAANRTNVLDVARLAPPPVVDGRLDEWPSNGWVTIDVRTQQVGDWGHRKVKTEAAVAVAGDRLYAAFRTTDRDLANNACDALPMLFKSGGGFDLMLGCDAAADPRRAAAVAGDVRLVVARARNGTVAALYRPVAPGAGTPPVPFGSPLRTLLFDRVDDVSAVVELASSWTPDDDPRDKARRLGHAAYELSVPLATLGLTVRPGLVLRGDVGVLRGNGTETLQRACWANKASGITADVPSEAELLPRLWGEWRFPDAP